MTARGKGYDLAVIGAGILGLACAKAAAERGLKVVVLERHARAEGASIRNFGFITVTGQEREAVWPRARRSREVWDEVAPLAGIAIEQRGSWVAARRPEAAAVLEAFMRTDMGEGCRLLGQSAVQQRCPELAAPGLVAVLESPHERRVESRTAIGLLAAWLARDRGVVFHWRTTVHALAPQHVETSNGRVAANAVVVCPGDDLWTLYPERLAGAAIGRCRLQMMRLESPGFRLPATLMADLSVARYGGFASLPEAAALKRRLELEQPEHLRQGIHLIVAQGADGSLVVGDSHDSASPTEPFLNENVYALLLEEYHAVTGRLAPAVRERWSGTYAVASDRVLFVDAPAPNVRLVLVTSGVGASTGFAIGEEVIAELCG